MSSKIFVGLAAAAVLLTGCGGGGSESSDPPVTQPATVAPSSAAPSSAAPSSTAPSSAAPSSKVALSDPCKVVPASAAEELIGYAFASAKAGTVAGSTLCSYVPAADDGVSLIAQEIALTGDFDRFAAAAVAQLPGAKTVDVEVDGADQASFVTAELSGSPTVAVLAGADGVFYQVIVGGPKLSTDDGRKAATTYAAALIKG